MSLLTVHDVHRSYRGPAGDVPVLRGVSLQVPEGGVHAICLLYTSDAADDAPRV